MCVHLVTNKVISSQPFPDLQSKNFFFKSFSIWSIKLEYFIRKIKWVIIWSRIRSFRHSLFLNSNSKTYFTKVSTFDQLNMKMISENWNACSFRHKLNNFVKTISFSPIWKFLLLKFCQFGQFNENMTSGKLNQCLIGHKLSHFDTFGHRLGYFVTAYSWPPIQKLLLQKFLHLINWIWKWYQKTEMRVHFVTN